EGFSDRDPRSMLWGYYIVTHAMLRSLTPPPTGPDDKIKKAVQDAVTTDTKDVDVKRDGKRITIGLSGVTGELTKGLSTSSLTVGPGGVTVKSEKPGGTVSAGVSWGGTLSVAGSKGNFYLTTSLSKDKWEVKLSYPSDTPIPDLSKLGQVFGEGEKSLREVVRTTSGISDLKDVRQKIDVISPQVDK